MRKILIIAKQILIDTFLILFGIIGFAVGFLFFSLGYWTSDSLLGYGFLVLAVLVWLGTYFIIEKIIQKEEKRLAKEKVTSKDIKIALSDYHQKDYFITECKTCSTYFPDQQGLLIFDGLAVRKSYTGPCITGYEIKVSRGDFLQDAKWHLYLQYCNEFYFVVPNGLIKKEELPDNVGLIYYYPETGCLKKKKKAAYRQIEEPVGVYKYIIFSRLEQDRLPFYESRAEYAKDYLRNIADKKIIGNQLGSEMAKELQMCYQKLDSLKGAAEKKELLDGILKVLNDHGIWTWRKPEQIIEELKEALRGTYPDDLDLVERNIRNALERLERIKQEHEGGEENGSQDKPT